MKVELNIIDDTGKESKHILFVGNDWERLKEDLNNMKGINAKQEFFKFLTYEMKLVLQQITTGLSGSWDEYRTL